ncbi:hypothetical protein ALC56_07149, partial [Trachymyrmex septentrionalis]
ILIVIDVLSKYAWALPLKSKNGNDVAAALSKILLEDERNLQTDRRKEFYNTTFVKTQRTNPATYLLKDYQGKPIADGFYEHELQRVSNPDIYLVEKILRKRGNKVYVKWLGMDSSHNSWIDETNVL